jgi:hypothetical protein
VTRPIHLVFDERGEVAEYELLPDPTARLRELGWQPLDLVELAQSPPQPPEVARLFYCGKRHLVSGEFETGKSWLAIAAAAVELLEGRGVVWIDEDQMGPASLLERLRAFGVPDQAISSRFAYIRPERAADEEAVASLREEARAREARLVVVDSLNPALARHDLDLNSSADVERFFQLFADPLCDEGAAFVALDHVVKNSENRGRYAYGSERKGTGSHVHLGLRVVEPFGRDRTGKARITVHKDREGFLERPIAGLFVLESENGRCTWRLEADESHDAEGKFRPTGYMERVSRYLELRDPEPQALSQIEKQVIGKAEHIRQAVEQLLAESYVGEQEGPRGARLLTVLRSFREGDE